MEKEFRRTNETFLKDEELILFDAMFDKNPHLPLLQKDIFCDVFNTTYCHNFDNKELDKIIEKFCSSGYFCLSHIQAKASEVTFVGLTSKGGELWEKERQPKWELFCADSCQPDNSEHYSELSICSPSVKVAQDFFATARECHLYELEASIKVSITELNNYELVQ